MGVGERFLEALYPMQARCWLCGEELRRGERTLCAECEKLLEPARERDVTGLDGFIAGLSYTEAVHSALHRFKYKGEAYLAGFFAGYVDIPEDWHIDFLVPVPLHRARKRVRGYNQSELLCDELEERLGILQNDGLIARVRNTRTQTRLSGADRLGNLAGAFQAKSCEGMRLLLVDDVCTTGSTLLACADELRAKGACAVYGAAACSADKEEQM